jgi:hypothetical protein
VLFSKSSLSTLTKQSYLSHDITFQCPRGVMALTSPGAPGFAEVLVCEGTAVATCGAEGCSVRGHTESLLLCETVTCKGARIARKVKWTSAGMDTTPRLLRVGALTPGRHCLLLMSDIAKSFPSALSLVSKWGNRGMKQFQASQPGGSWSWNQGWL